MCGAFLPPENKNDATCDSGNDTNLIKHLNRHHTAEHEEVEQTLRPAARARQSSLAESFGASRQYPGT